MNRLERVYKEMEKQGLEQILVTDPHSIWYLTGIANEPYERLWVLYLSRKCKPILDLLPCLALPQIAIGIIFPTNVNQSSICCLA